MSWKNVEKDVEGGPLGLVKWIAIFIVAMTVLFGGINLFMKPATMAVDRIVMKNSFQYVEGMEQRAAILEANIIEVNELIRQQPNNSSFQSQKRILTAQLRAITINE